MKELILTSLDMAARISVLVIALIMAAFIAFAGARHANAASLNADVILTGDVLTVGDIFVNAGRNSEYVLGPAPKPGEPMILNASALMRIATALDLPWRPASALDQVTITRAATIIPAADVDAALTQGLSEAGVTGRFSVAVNGGQSDILLPQDKDATVEIRDVIFDPRTATFTASLFSPSRSDAVVKKQISGQVRQMVTVPVLKTPLRNGDLIGHADIDFIELESRTIGPDVILNADELVNMTPRRMAAANQPIRLLDVQRPELVNRGKNVTIVFRQGPLFLTATGRALQNGADGDLVRVVNLASNTQIDAVVTGSHEVSVTE